MIDFAKRHDWIYAAKGNADNELRVDKKKETGTLNIC